MSTNMNVPTAVSTLRAFLDTVESHSSLMTTSNNNSNSTDAHVDASFINDFLRTFLSSQSRVPRHISIARLTALPTELELSVFSFLNASSLVQVALINRQHAALLASRPQFSALRLLSSSSSSSTSSFGHLLTVGDRCDALDKKGVWYAARVLDCDNQSLRVHFDGFGVRWDESIERASAERWAPLRSHSVPLSAAPACVASPLVTHSAAMSAAASTLASLTGAQHGTSIVVIVRNDQPTIASAAHSAASLEPQQTQAESPTPSRTVFGSLAAHAHNVSPRWTNFTRTHSHSVSSVSSGQSPSATFTTSGDSLNNTPSAGVAHSLGSLHLSPLALPAVAAAAPPSIAMTGTMLSAAANAAANSTAPRPRPQFAPATVFNPRH